MTKITYNFTDGHNKDVKDKVPDWMDSLFNNNIKKSEPVIINDLYANNRVNIKKCIMCGKPLNSNEISKCYSCNSIKNK